MDIQVAAMTVNQELIVQKDHFHVQIVRQDILIVQLNQHKLAIVIWLFQVENMLQQQILQLQQIVPLDTIVHHITYTTEVRVVVANVQPEHIVPVVLVHVQAVQVDIQVQREQLLNLNAI